METESTVKTILKAITQTFGKICSSFSRHGIIIGLLVAAVIILMYSAIIHPINIDSIVQKAFEKERTETAEAVQSGIEQRIRADELIEPVLEDIVMRYGLDRAMLLEKHNSVSNISGVDFLYFSATLEVLNVDDLDLTYIGDNFQRQYVSNMLGELIKVLKYKPYLYVSDISQCNHPHHRIMRKLHEYGANSLLFIPLKNRSNQPLVIVCFMSRSNEMDYEGIVRDFSEHERIIHNALINE